MIETPKIRSAKLVLARAFWTDPRFERLQAEMEWELCQAAGFLSVLWGRTRDARREHWTIDELLHLMPFTRDAACTLRFHALRESGYVTPVEGAETWMLPDNEAYLTRVANLRRVGGMRKAKVVKERKPRKPKLVAPGDAQFDQACAQAWAAYSDAFTERYGVEAAPNARARSLLRQFVQRVGQQEAAEVLRFYVAHEDAFYRRKHHDIGPAVTDAENLLTQWRRGQPMTGEDIRATAGANSLQAQLARISAD